MRTKAIDPEYYTNPELSGGRIVTFDSKYPKINGVELPITCAKPEVLVTPKGKIVEYLINYKPWEDADTNVEKTRHCYYVDETTWLEIKKFWDEFAEPSRKVA